MEVQSTRSLLRCWLPPNRTLWQLVRTCLDHALKEKETGGGKIEEDEGQELWWGRNIRVRSSWHARKDHLSPSQPHTWLAVRQHHACCTSAPYMLYASTMRAVRQHQPTSVVTNLSPWDATDSLIRSLVKGTDRLMRMELLLSMPS